VEEGETWSSILETRRLTLRHAASEFQAASVPSIKSIALHSRQPSRRRWRAQASVRPSPGSGRPAACCVDPFGRPTPVETSRLGRGMSLPVGGRTRLERGIDEPFGPGHAGPPAPVWDRRGRDGVRMASRTQQWA
jgi:hypothetical protein